MVDVSRRMAAAKAWQRGRGWRCSSDVSPSAEKSYGEENPPPVVGRKFLGVGSWSLTCTSMIYRGRKLNHCSDIVFIKCGNMRKHPIPSMSHTICICPYDPMQCTPHTPCSKRSHGPEDSDGRNDTYQTGGFHSLTPIPVESQNSDGSSRL